MFKCYSVYICVIDVIFFFLSFASSGSILYGKHRSRKYENGICLSDFPWSREKNPCTSLSFSAWLNLLVLYSCSFLCFQTISLLFLRTTTCFTFGPFFECQRQWIMQTCIRTNWSFFFLWLRKRDREREKESAIMPLRWPQQMNDTCFGICCNFFQIYLSCILGRRRQQCAPFVCIGTVCWLYFLFVTHVRLHILIRMHILNQRNRLMRWFQCLLLQMSFKWKVNEFVRKLKCWYVWNSHAHFTVFECWRRPIT